MKKHIKEVEAPHMVPTVSACYPYLVNWIKEHKKERKVLIGGSLYILRYVPDNEEAPIRVFKVFNPLD